MPLLYSCMEYIDPKLLEKYAAGQCSESEIIAVEKWLNDQQNLPSIEASVFTAEEHQETEAFLWSQIEARRHVNKRKFFIFNSRFGAAIAACMVMAIATIFYLAYRSKSNVPELITFQAKNGHIDTLLLTDGSRVILNAGAKLIYPKEFSGVSREIQLLEGEAFFEVQKNPAKPFIVHTDSTEVKVLGTKFNINKSGNKISVILKEGKVAFKKGKDAVILLPGQRAMYSAANGISMPDQVNLNQYLSWRAGVLWFEDRPMDEVLDALGKRYDLKFVVKQHHINQLLFTGKIKTENAAEALKLIMLSSNLHFKSVGDRTINVY